VRGSKEEFQKICGRLRKNRRAFTGGVSSAPASVDSRLPTFGVLPCGCVAGARIDSRQDGKHRQQYPYSTKGEHLIASFTEDSLHRPDKLRSVSRFSFQNKVSGNAPAWKNPPDELFGQK
jgi:hypothetical protein